VHKLLELLSFFILYFKLLGSYLTRQVKNV